MYNFGDEDFALLELVHLGDALQHARLAGGDAMAHGRALGHDPALALELEGLEKVRILPALHRLRPRLHDV
jgi:hypothetical protein